MDLQPCSSCHKKLSVESFTRPNWKNTTTRVFKTCNTCNDNKKIRELQPKLNILFEKMNNDLNFISPFNNK